VEIITTQRRSVRQHATADAPTPITGTCVKTLVAFIMILIKGGKIIQHVRMIVKVVARS